MQCRLREAAEGGCKIFMNLCYRHLTNIGSDKAGSTGRPERPRRGQATVTRVIRFSHIDCYAAAMRWIQNHLFILSRATMKMLRSQRYLSVFIFICALYLLPPEVVSSGETEETAREDGENCVNGICINQDDLHKDELPEISSCTDLRDKCVEWASEGLCKTNWKFMHPHCPKTCNVCHNRTREVPESESFAPKTRGWAGEYVIHDAIGADLGEPQIIKNITQKNAMIALIERARYYVEDIVMVEARYELVRDMCRNLNESCAQWAIEGKCNDDEEFMDENCAPVCFRCEQLHIEAKCPIDPAIKNAWYRGDLNRMFERIVSDPALQQYRPDVLSRPSYAEGDTTETAEYQLGPWVVVLDDFVPPEECERLIQLGTEAGYERSTEVNGLDESGNMPDRISRTRTSTNAWCHEGCYNDPIVVGVLERMEHLTGIPRGYAEDLQLLRYEEGQFYLKHHDYITTEASRMEGVRILTVFLYLNDVEEGGGTSFSDRNLLVEPKRGRALLWPSVLDENPHERDDRTRHEALLVIKGVKYAANAWFHQGDYQYATEIGC